MTRSDLTAATALVLLLGAPLALAAKHAQDRSKEVQCAKNLESLWLVMGNYLVQFGGPQRDLPTETGDAFWLKLTKTQPPMIYAHETGVFQCPVEGFEDEGIDYRGPKGDIKKYGDNDPIGADVVGNHCGTNKGLDVGGNVILKSGDVRTVKANDPLWIRAAEMTTGGSKAVPPLSPIQKRKRAMRDIGQIVVAVWSYHETHGIFPKSLRHLVEPSDPANSSRALHEDMVAPEDGFLPGGKLPEDPWQNDYRYEVRNGHPHVWSRGADNKDGGTDDGRDVTMEDAFPTPARKCRERVRELSVLCENAFGARDQYPPSGITNLSRALRDRLGSFDPPIKLDLRLINDGGALIDVWGRPYVYRNNKQNFPKNQNDPNAHNKQTFDLYSVGANGTDEGGTGDDIGNWGADYEQSRGTPQDLSDWVTVNHLRQLRHADFREAVRPLQGKQVLLSARVFNIEVLTAGYTDPTTGEKHPNEIYGVYLMSPTIQGTPTFLEIPDSERIFIRCLDVKGTRFEGFLRGDLVAVEGTVWGTDPGGSWSVVYLKDYSLTHQPDPRTTCRRLVRDLTQACERFKMDFNLYPRSGNSNLVKNLSRLGEKKTPFFQFPPDSLNARGEVIDPWGHPLKYEVRTIEGREYCYIVSVGPNGIDDNGEKDDIANR